MYVKYGRSVGGKNTSVFAGVGTSADPYIDPATNTTANLNFEGIWVKDNATSGTTRGTYRRLYLSGGAGGECIRAFTTVESNTPADTVNGSHISLNFGATVGNVTGLGTGIRSTLHIPNRALTGTTAAMQAELFADGASSDLGGITSFVRMVADGNATGVGKIDASGFLFDIDGLTAGASNLFRTGLTAATINAATTAALKIQVGAATYYIPIATATA